MKGENNKSFEIILLKFDDLNSLFDREFLKNGLSITDIQTSKISILTNLLKQSLTCENK